MKNVFSFTEAKILSGGEVLSGGGAFLLYGTRGILDIERGGRHTLLSSDEVFFGEPLDGYSSAPSDASAGAEAILISVSGELTRSLSELYEIRDSFTVKAPETRELFEELYRLKSSTEDVTSENEAAASLVFHKLMFALSASPGNRRAKRTAVRIREHLDSHVEEKTDLDRLSGIFFMSKTQIYRLFKEEYGVSPIRYLTERKIRLSKKLLQNTELKLSEIAETLSFSDAKHFSKTFFKYTGMLPSEYRKHGCKG